MGRPLFVAHFVTQVVSASPATYAIVFAVVAVDALLPFAQAEAVVITAAVLAAEGRLLIWAVVIAAAIAGFIGDNAAYFLGRGAGRRLVDRFFARGRGANRLKRAELGIRRQGALLIVIGRFIPIGRTATTFSAGTLGMPWRRFAVADAVAAVLWAVYASMLGYAGGASFAHSFWKPLACALGAAAVLALAGEGYRRIQKVRGRDILSGQLR